VVDPIIVRDTVRYKFGSVCIKLDNGDVRRALIASLNCALGDLDARDKAADSKVSKHEAVEFRDSGSLAKNE